MMNKCPGVISTSPVGQATGQDPEGGHGEGDTLIAATATGDSVEPRPVGYVLHVNVPVYGVLNHSLSILLLDAYNVSYTVYIECLTLCSRFFYL